MKARLVALAAVAVLPSTLKRFCYRAVFGYRIGDGVRIGFSIIDAERCEIGDEVVIGHLNVFTGISSLRIGDHARVGYLNVIRGGAEVRLGRYSEISRLNEINSIPDPMVANDVDPRFLLGDGSAVTAGHKIDFTDHVEIGKRSVIAGRNSSLWTHNRQRTKPITVGSWSYVGSEVRMAPGSSIPSECIVGMGAVVTKSHSEGRSFVAGVPARVVRGLRPDDRALLDWRWRPDLPDDL